MSEFPKADGSEYVSSRELNPEELKTVIENSSRFLGMHTCLEMLYYFDQDPWISTQIAYYSKLLNERNLSAIALLESVMKSEWNKHKKMMGHPEMTITKIQKKNKKK